MGTDRKQRIDLVDANSMSTDHLCRCVYYDRAMFERDFLMRQVQQLTQLLAKIARLRNSEQLTTALEEIAAGYEQLGITKSMLEYLDVASLIRKIEQPELLLAIGRVMEQEAAILEEQGDVRAEAKKQRAEALIAAAG